MTSSSLTRVLSEVFVARRLSYVWGTPAETSTWRSTLTDVVELGEGGRSCRAGSVAGVLNECSDGVEWSSIGGGGGIDVGWKLGVFVLDKGELERSDWPGDCLRDPRE